MTTLLIATRNAHKAREIGQILGGDVRCLTLNDFPGAPVPVEDAETFAGNATLKVLSLAEWLATHPAPVGRPFYIVADDSGLEVDALNGAPGVHSARFAADDMAGAGNAPDAANNAKLLRLLARTPAVQHTARFRCVLAVLRHAAPFSTSDIVLFDGVCEGRISAAPSGIGGFGYDPLFVPDGCAQSFAELGDEVKNKLSHRAQALSRLRQFLNKKN
jgi:XTP/dITP diphosphohydrolase